MNLLVLELMDVAGDVTTLESTLAFQHIFEKPSLELRVHISYLFQLISLHI